MSLRDMRLLAAAYPGAFAAVSSMATAGFHGYPLGFPSFPYPTTADQIAALDCSVRHHRLMQEDGVVGCGGGGMSPAKLASLGVTSSMAASANSGGQDGSGIKVGRSCVGGGVKDGELDNIGMDCGIGRRDMTGSPGRGGGGGGGGGGVRCGGDKSPAYHGDIQSFMGPGDCVGLAERLNSSGITVTLACSSTSILACSDHIDNLQPKDYMRTEYLCKKVHLAMDCLDMELEKCPDYFQDLLDHVRVEIDQVRTECTPGNNCTAEDIMSCIRPLHNLSPKQAQDSDIFCRRVTKAKECLEEEKDTCPDYMKKEIEEGFGVIEQATVVCNPNSAIDTNYYSHYDESCSYNNIVGCIKPLTSISPSAPELCPKFHTALDCLEREMETCHDDMDHFVRSAFRRIRYVRRLCREDDDDDGGISWPTGADDHYHKSDEDPDVHCVEDKLDHCMMQNHPRPPSTAEKTCSLYGEAKGCMSAIERNRPCGVYNDVSEMNRRLENMKLKCELQGHSTGNNADILQTNFFLLFLTAMLVNLRHFLRILKQT